MSKNPPTIQASLSSKTSLKPKNSTKGFERNLMLDLNSKFDMRSPTANPNAISEKQFYSPTIPADKGGAVQNQAKSPRAKNNIVTITTDHADAREGAGFDNKVHPQTTKTLRSSYAAPTNTEKFKPVPNSNEKMMPTKPRESFVKVGAPKYEAFLSKKIAQNATAQNKDNSKTDLTINLKDSKIKIMEEPPKKLSMPVNTILTPNNLHTNPGSNSHRAPSSNAGMSEQMKISNKATPQTAHLYRKDSQKSDTENEVQQPATVGISVSGGKQHHPLSALLAELGTVSPKHAQGMSRINMGTLGNTSGHNINVSDNIASPKEGPNGPTVQNNDLIKLLNDKNREIYRLTNDKLELKSTLESLNGEISGLKKMKMLLREKEKIIEDLQNSLCEAAKESDELMRELQKENLIPRDASFNDSQGQIHNKKNNNNISIGDIEGVKMLISQLKALTDDTVDPVGSQKNVDQKRSLVEAMMRKNQNAKNKRTEAAYESFSLEKRGDKTAQSPDPYATVDIYQRNFSSTLEESLARKTMESPYYDAMKNTVRRNGKTMSEAKLVDNKKGEAQSTKVLPSGNAIIKRGDSLLGTPRKLHVSPEKVEKQFRVQPNTTSSGEAEILARKFSHDPKLVSKGSSEFGNKKQSIAEAGSTLAYTTEKETNGEAQLDIGKGLSELKDRIARLLNRQRDDHKMLKETHDMYLKKFQELLKS